MALNAVDKKNIIEGIRTEKDIDSLLRSLSKEAQKEILKIAGGKDKELNELTPYVVALSPLLTKFWDEVEDVSYLRSNNVSNFVVNREKKHFKDYVKSLKAAAPKTKQKAISKFEKTGLKEYDQYLERTKNLIKGRQLFDGKTIGNRIVSLKGSTKRNVQNILAVGIKEGKSARNIAKDIDGYIYPKTGIYKSPFAYYRERFGKSTTSKIFGNLIKKGYISKGSISYQAMRIARTEVNLTARNTMRRLYKDASFVKGYKWHLSASHPDIGCECEELASRKILSEVPDLPHPTCMCYVTVVFEDPNKFYKEL